MLLCGQGRTQKVTIRRHLLACCNCLREALRAWKVTCKHGTKAAQELSNDLLQLRDIPFTDFGILERCPVAAAVQQKLLNQSETNLDALLTLLSLLQKIACSLKDSLTELANQLEGSTIPGSPYQVAEAELMHSLGLRSFVVSGFNALRGNCVGSTAQLLERDAAQAQMQVLLTAWQTQTQHDNQWLQKTIHSLEAEMEVLPECHSARPSRIATHS